MSLARVFYRMLLGAHADSDAAVDEASRLRAKEEADHKAWLRENADSVTVPEHPAVALLRTLQYGGWVFSEGGTKGEHACPVCLITPWDGKGAHADGCALAAILASSKPGDRALSDLLAEAREEGRKEAAATMLSAHEARADGYAEALQKHIAERSAVYSAHELGALADELDEDNYATAAKKLRAAIMTIARLEEQAKTERAKSAEEEREACAVLAETFDDAAPTDPIRKIRERIARRIRARGQR